ncbi:tumor necrosis factor alpha-induced protein 2a isoform X3 [Betta splendens]|uniref:Tumor necrosis factor alpha-induced protein 2a isoform X3 n=1 Tax=Betta splendens TaxID=158456 RepID=A0A6P7LNS2_BETSP|nr:tumor necrosis factor alpha-induced protein 2a isoform X3 [Betta splendens]
MTSASLDTDTILHNLSLLLTSSQRPALTRPASNASEHFKPKIIQTHVNSQEPGETENPPDAAALDPNPLRIRCGPSCGSDTRLFALCSESETKVREEAGDVQENNEKRRKKEFKLKIHAFFKKNHKQENRVQAADDNLECVEERQQEQEEEELLENISRRLMVQEEQLFSQDTPSEQEQDQLHKDFEALIVQVWITINNTFIFSTPQQLKVLKSAVAIIQGQEEQDRRWAGCVDGPAPVWRPQKCVSTHNNLLQNMVESRLKEAVGHDSGEPSESTWSPVKKEVFRLGKCVKKDLLAVVKVKDCYPPQMDIINLYAGLYHQRFSSRLADLAVSDLGTDDCCYVLLWVNHCYPCEILKHKELDGKVKAACLGSLLLPETLNQLEEQYLTGKQDKVKLWLQTVLKTEEQSWMNGSTPKIVDAFYYSPLAVDVIQIIDGSLSELSHVIRDQSKAQRVTQHLEAFLISYKKRVEEFVKGNHWNVIPVVKAQLACEEQLRDYVTGTGRLSEEQRRQCLHSLSALRDCGYSCFTCPIHAQLKMCCSQLWTPVWLDGSLPVIDALLDFMSQQLTDLADLQPVCRQSLLHIVYESVVLQYVRKMMKARVKIEENAAQQIVEDAQNINDFFSERGCSGSSWLSEMLCSIAEILRLKDPGSVQLEMAFLAQRFPDLSDAHVLALLSLKTGLSSSDVRSIRRSVAENRSTEGSANRGPLFFSKVKVRWINAAINQMGVLTSACQNPK